jgi:hypothetical protein
MEYTEEMGIGFKSVFSVATKVHIRSPPFFMFDKTRELGMMTPLWDADCFNHSISNAQTEIILEQPPPESMILDYTSSLCDEFLHLDSAFLMSLRRLRRIQMVLLSGINQSILERTLNMTESNHIISVTNATSSNHQTTNYYYKYQHVLSHLSEVPGRTDMTLIEISIAFPIEQEQRNWKPIQNVQPVFAFLLLGKFGFNVSPLYLHSELEDGLTWKT